MKPLVAFSFLVLLSLESLGTQVILASRQTTEEQQALADITSFVEIEATDGEPMATYRAGFLTRVRDEDVMDNEPLREALVKASQSDACIYQKENIAPAANGKFGCVVLHKDGPEIQLLYLAMDVDFSNEERHIYRGEFSFPEPSNQRIFDGAKEQLIQSVIDPARPLHIG